MNIIHYPSTFCPATYIYNLEKFNKVLKIEFFEYILNIDHPNREFTTFFFLEYSQLLEKSLFNNDVTYKQTNNIDDK